MGIKAPNINLPKNWREGFFAFLVLCFFAYSLKSNWLQGKRVSPPSEPKEYSLEKKESLRAPAAVDMNSKEKTTYSLMLGCLDSPGGKSYQTTAALVQIQWDKCSVKEKIEAKNQTTGENLLLLENGTKIFTHYFPLKPGKNEIFIETSGKKGLRSSIELIRN